MYRSIILSTLILCAGLAPLHSQDRSDATDVGAVLASGTVAVSSQGRDSGDRLNIFALGTGLFTFVSPGLGLGGDLTFTTMSRGGSSSTSYGIGPKLGYFFDSGERTIPFIGAGISYLGATSTHGSSDGAIRAKLGAGLLFRQDHLGIIVEAAYLMDEYENSSSNIFLINVGFAGLFF